MQMKRLGLLVLLVLLLPAVLGYAQDDGLDVGENAFGEVTAAGQVVSFALNNNSPQSVTIQVLALTEGFLPTVTIVDPAGVVQTTNVNPNNLTILETDAVLTVTGLYTIEVGSSNNSTGQFVISVQGGEAITPPLPLNIGVEEEGTLDTAAPTVQYTFDGVPSEILLLTIRSLSPTSGPFVILQHSETGEILAQVSTLLIGAQFRIPAGSQNYVLSLSQGAQTLADQYTVCLETESETARCPGEGAPTPTVGAPTATPIPIILPTLPTTGACVIATAGAGSVNVRSGPGLNFSIITVLPYTTFATVLGRLADSSWYNIDFNGTIGWVSGTVVRLGGDCSTVPTVTPPPPSATATPTGTLTVTATATTDPNATETATPPDETETIIPPGDPTMTATATETEIPPTEEPTATATNTEVPPT